MVDATHVSFRADDRSYFSLLKKEIHKQAIASGYDASTIAHTDLIVAELTSNLHKHAVGGEFLFADVKEESGEYLEFITLDNGPGIADIPRMMGDGVSTKNTLGQGLGSIKRLSDTFDIYSQRNWGTIALARVYKHPKVVQKNAKDQVNSLVVAKPGENLSGDGTYAKYSQDRLKILIADGLGHGPEANRAVNEAVEAFKLCPSNSPVEILRFIHTSIRKTRGIVGTVIVCDIKTKMWTVAGIGNISCKFMNGMLSKNVMSYNGIVGHNIPGTLNDLQLPVADFPQFIACSDGLKSRWDSLKYPGIHKCDPMVLAAALYKDFGRRTDDMSVVIGKIEK